MPAEWNRSKVTDIVFPDLSGFCFQVNCAAIPVVNGQLEPKCQQCCTNPHIFAAMSESWVAAWRTLDVFHIHQHAFWHIPIGSQANQLFCIGNFQCIFLQCRILNEGRQPTGLPVFLLCFNKILLRGRADICYKFSGPSSTQNIVNRFHPHDTSPERESSIPQTQGKEKRFLRSSEIAPPFTKIDSSKIGG